MPEIAIAARDKVADLKKKVDEIRYSKIYQASIPYTFPGDQTPDGIQMRNEIDRQNIQDLVADAMMSEPSATMYFMPTSNNLKTLTAQDILDMGKFLKTRGDQIVAHAWQLKGQINPENLDVNIQEGWPV